MKLINFFKSDNQINPIIEYTGITKYMPLFVCGGFFLITIILFAIGPFNWNITNTNKLYTFLIFSFIFLCLGYILGVKLKIRKTDSNFNINHIIYVSFFLFIICYVLNVYSTTGKIFPDVINGLINSGEAYRTSHEINSTLTMYLIYAGILLSPLTSLITPLYFIYFKNLSITSKILGTTVLVLNLFLGIAQGVINSYALLAFQICMFLIIYLFSNFKKKTYKNIISVVLIILTISASFLVYYRVVMSNRLIEDAKGETQTNNKDSANNDKINEENNVDTTNNNDSSNNDKINEENIDDTTNNNDIIKDQINNMYDLSSEYITQASLKDKHLYSFLPDSIESSLNHIVGYVTHGYKGLSIALDCDFTSSYGLGFSDFFRHNLLKIMGKTELEEQIYQRTYMYKITQNGWATGNVWVSFFVYPASDIGFPLTIILVFGIGILFSLSWRDTIESKNIFAAVIFMNFCMIICFFCANNVYFQNGGPFLTIISMSILWIISKLFRKKV